MSMAVTMTMVGWLAKQGLLGVVVGHVGEHAVLEVTTEETLLRERHCVLKRVHSPPERAAEEEGAVGLLRHVLVQVVLEKLPLS